MSSHRHSHFSAVTAAALLGLPVAAAMAQQADNLQQGENGQNMAEGSSSALREKLLLSQATINGLTESLAVANGEAELFKRKSDDLNERVEALGIAPAGKEGTVLQSRLLAAVRDLRLLQNENDAAREHLVSLSEAVMALLKTSEGIDAKARLKVEEDLRSSSAFLQRKNLPGENSADLTSGAVVDFKPDLSLIVANLGLKQGVKVGMPFQVWRGNRQIGMARIVDVRDSISGAIVQDTATPALSIRAGDSLRIDTTR